MARRRARPRCIIIAGPNGAGKTTFARDYLPSIARLTHFINADLIAGGMSPLQLAERRHYAKRIEDWKTQGYLIEIVYLRLDSPQLALRRIASRVRQGGHDVPRADVIRRFKRGWTNFLDVYRPLADHWTIYGNSESKPKFLERGP
jgi:predicted ABC-type ATPase